MQMIDSEERCCYCTKPLSGLNEFNRRMHFDTCKVRKAVESNGLNSLIGSPNSSQNDNDHNPHDDSNSDNYVIIGENCTYCFKSFKDFKSDFNKRLHLRCCRDKKLNYERKNSMNLNKIMSQQQNNGLTAAPMPNSAYSEPCVYCTKPLGNLNEFNKKMHIENCKIRKSIEANIIKSSPNNKSPNTNNKNDSTKDENTIRDLGTHCIYCSKSFLNLSEFNKKLHNEYCKTRKRKSNQQNANGSTSTGNDMFNQMSTSSTSNDSNNSNNSNSNNNNNNNTSINQQDVKPNMINLGENCSFCARSLMNLSNFNKKVHIDTCKIKQLKKANAMKARQLNKSVKKRSHQQQPQQQQQPNNSNNMQSNNNNTNQQNNNNTNQNPNNNNNSNNTNMINLLNIKKDKDIPLNHNNLNYCTNLLSLDNPGNQLPNPYNHHHHHQLHHNHHHFDSLTLTNNLNLNQLSQSIHPNSLLGGVNVGVGNLNASNTVISNGNGLQGNQNNDDNNNSNNNNTNNLNVGALLNGQVNTQTNNLASSSMIANMVTHLQLAQMDPNSNRIFI